ncbi:MAG: alkaline phosphatase [Acidiphilium sp. 37-64-53]|uniref:DedA family protein n=1 Tax=Acidiphilium TaxID=522 RepID=UPI000BCCE000|nr:MULTISPECIES: DedA family protein [Acidiphilium]OYW00394.1 MAG: alkaline phosphatase [Acidiphilium sp. 37-64-53]OZB23484.1 MAG: alkaline phosphatase [Acidiphilium sp. 34-64-41]HQT83771.1 DedA family protein [Acidiphilium rubrum]
MIAALAHFVIATISSLGYAGIAVLMALESACIPIPSEVILPFAGYLVSTGRFDLWLVAIVGALGCNIGSTIAYAFGYAGGRPLVERFGRYILLDRAELTRVEGFFARYGSVTVLVSRMLPVVRTYIALPAGMARMNFWKFQAYTFIGSLPWCLALAYVGFRLGKAWETNPRLHAVMHDFTIATVAVLACLIVWYGVRVWRGRAQRAG